MMEAMIPSKSCDESLDWMKKKEAKEAQIKKEKEAKEAHQKMREKREGAMLLSFFHTCASK